jgi:hypothetical protein
MRTYVPFGASLISGSSGEGTAGTLVYKFFLEGIIIEATKESRVYGSELEHFVSKDLLSVYCLRRRYISAPTK